jgi:hypothetical protein
VIQSTLGKFDSGRSLDHQLRTTFKLAVFIKYAPRTIADFIGEFPTLKPASDAVKKADEIISPASDALGKLPSAILKIFDLLDDPRNKLFKALLFASYVKDIDRASVKIYGGLAKLTGGEKPPASVFHYNPDLNPPSLAKAVIAVKDLGETLGRVLGVFADKKGVDLPKLFGETGVALVGKMDLEDYVGKLLTSLVQSVVKERCKDLIKMMRDTAPRREEEIPGKSPIQASAEQQVQEDKDRFMA